ncbi:hypothetical protein SELMODRAFT_404783 [Selaginella moellendorffii]|uniref:Uncharacterized protein n=1 Tax=Selaginella moellendorffii TaxID=88036 RepID=D8QXC2_SELML|nr:hypothetical protein SELMODRAFT_404783 [Selaginella moellendorffii]
MGGGNKWHSCVGDIKSHAGFGWMCLLPSLQALRVAQVYWYNRVGFYKAFLFWQPTVLAATPEVCKFVLSKDSFETGWPESAVALMGRNLFAGLTGGSHMKLRKFTKHAVNNPKALKQYVPLIVNNINALQVDLHSCRLNTRRAWVALSLMVSVHLLSSDFQVIWHAEGQVHMDPNVHPDPEKFDLECCEKYGTSPSRSYPLGLKIGLVLVTSLPNFNSNLQCHPLLHYWLQSTYEKLKLLEFYKQCVRIVQGMRNSFVALLDYSTMLTRLE